MIESKSSPTLANKPDYKMRDHRKLRAFELADELTLSVYRFTATFPSDERFGLTSQMRRSAVSIVSNIVEGCARNTQADYLRFLDIAHGSARELDYKISLAKRLGYVDERNVQEIENRSVETCKVLNGLIASLRRRPEA